MSLSSLPIELMFCVAGFLEKSSLSSFIRTNKYFAQALTPCLYDDEIQFRNGPRRKLDDPNCLYDSFISIWESDIILDYFRTRPLEMLNSVYEDGEPLFHRVILRRNFKLAEIFISKGVDIDTADSSGRTLLLRPRAYENEGTVAKFLIDNGANLMATAYGGSAFIVAAKYAPAATIERIVNEFKSAEITADAAAGVSVQHRIGQMFHQAIYFGDMEKISLLLKHGASPSSVCNGFTPLMRAVYRGHDPVVNLFLDLGANMWVGFGRATILSVFEITNCCTATINRIIATVVEARGDISAPGCSICHQNVGRVSDTFDGLFFPDQESFLAHGEMRNKAFNTGITPLHYFTDYGDLKVVKTLINKGANVLTPTVVGAALKASFCWVNPLIYRGFERIEIFRELVLAATAFKEFDGTRAFDKDHGTILHCLARHGFADLTCLVIEASRNHNGKIGVDLLSLRFSRTAIYIAMLEGHEGVAETLFRAMKEIGYDFSEGVMVPDNNGNFSGERIPYDAFAEKCGMLRLWSLFRYEKASKRRVL